MPYPIETKIAPKASWFTPAEAKSYYGSYARQGVTVHWWGGGEGASSHDAIVNYFMAQGAKGIKSVNYVVSDIKITKMVEPVNVAFCSQSGNPVTVSIEFQPTLSDEGYKRGGWLISELEKQFGSLQLYKHSFWFPTSCPGSIDINRLRAEANKGDDMFEGKSAQQWANEAKFNLRVATDREDLLNKIGFAEGSGSGAIESDDVARIIAGIDRRNKEIDNLKAQLASEGTVLKPGKYLVK